MSVELPVFADNTKPSTCAGCSLYSEAHVDPGGPQKAEILVVGGFPLAIDARQGAFMSPGGNMVREVFKGINKTLSVEEQTTVAFAYAVACAPVRSGYKISVKEINHCQPQLHNTILQIQPDLIIALGADACKALGINSSMRAVRGNFTTVPVGDKRITVLPTYHPAAVMKSPGLFPVLKTDCEKACRRVKHGEMESNFQIDVPETFDQIMETLDNLEQFVAERYAESGKPRMIALDTETTSVTPHNPEDRVIMVSLSADEDHGIAFPFDHREYTISEEEWEALPPEEQNKKFSPKQVQEIGERLAEVTGSEKVALAEHNGKFDTKWLRYRYGLGVPFPKIDTMLLEHTLCEDKKGEYSLKDLTADYYPGCDKYEAELHTILGDIRKQREDSYKERFKQSQELQRDALVKFWVEELTSEERADFLSVWDSTGYIDLLKFGGAAEPKETKRGPNKGKITATCRNQIVRLQKLVPLELWPEGARSLVSQEKAKVEVPPVTFEDVPFPVLAKYAAIDAIMTRKVVQLQMPQFAPEHKKLVAALMRESKPLTGLKHPSWALNNITMPLCEVLADMEYHGVRLDRERTKQYIETIKEKMAECEDTMFESVGYKFNPRSSELGKILYEDLGLPVLKKSQLTGEPSTDADTLRELDEQHEVPFLKHLLVYRKLDKCASTYLGNWLKMSEMDGRIHAQFKQIGTATYRLSSSSPNLGQCFGGCKTA